MTDRKQERRPEAPKPEYQMFPIGLWHMLAAIILMLFCSTITLLLVSEILSNWIAERPLMYLELALLVIMVILLATPTFLLSRGWSSSHWFLVWQNRAYLLTLSASSIILLIIEDYGMAVTGVAGLVIGIAAHALYRSKRYASGVEHYRLIWQHYRFERHSR